MKENENFTGFFNKKLASRGFLVLFGWMTSA